MNQTLTLPHRTRQYGTLQTYQFPLLASIRHAVFTRQGGESNPPWSSLNMGHAVGDNPAHVQANFDHACQVLGLNPAQTAACYLVHGKRVVVAQAGLALNRLPQADALITQDPILCLTMRFADCTPLLFYEPNTKAIGLGHAGWRGTMQNVVGAVVDAMVEQFASKPTDIRLVIGPSIGPCCYQVGQDVFRAAQKAFIHPKDLFHHKMDGLYFNMWQANLTQAYQAGLNQIMLSHVCTACQTDQFFSHRAEKGQTGRFGVFLSLMK